MVARPTTAAVRRQEQYGWIRDGSTRFCGLSLPRRGNKQLRLLEPRTLKRSDVELERSRRRRRRRAPVKRITQFSVTLSVLLNFLVLTN